MRGVLNHILRWIAGGMAYGLLEILCADTPTGPWSLLAGAIIVLSDWMDYWLGGGERPRYKII